MVRRNASRLAAGLIAVAAVLAAPARSPAAFEILIQEVDSGGNIVFSPGGVPASAIFTSNVSGYSTPSFTNIAVSVISNSGTPASPSISTPLGAQSTANFDPTHSL